VEVVGILVPRRDRHHSRRHHRPIGADDEQRVALIGERVGDHGGQIEATGRLAQHHKPAVRGQVAGVARGCKRPACDRSQAGENVGHGGGESGA
jgi:hypothetical protein